MRLPFDPDQMGPLLTDFGRTVRRSGADEATDRETRQLLRPQAIGDQLFQALFSGPVRSLLDRSLGMTDRPLRKGLRIKLHIDPDAPALALIANLL